MCKGGGVRGSKNYCQAPGPLRSISHIPESKNNIFYQFLDQERHYNQMSHHIPSPFVQTCKYPHLSKLKFSLWKNDMGYPYILGFWGFWGELGGSGVMKIEKLLSSSRARAPSGPYVKFLSPKTTVSINFWTWRDTIIK